MFIVKAIRKGVPVHVIAQWQGRRNKGKLILDNNNYVKPKYSELQAAKMS